MRTTQGDGSLFADAVTEHACDLVYAEIVRQDGFHDGYEPTRGEPHWAQGTLTNTGAREGQYARGPVCDSLRGCCPSSSDPIM
jgi:hypothetical protein